MPTIELISIGCPRVPRVPRYRTFGWLAERNLASHRGLFQSLFDEQAGVIFHLGNKDQEKDPGGCWFAGGVMDWTEDRTVFFPSEAFAEFQDFVQRLLRASSEQRVIFSTDYQFGGRRSVFGEVRRDSFFAMHNARKLKYNALYYIRK